MSKSCKVIGILRNTSQLGLRGLKFEISPDPRNSCVVCNFFLACYILCGAHPGPWPDLQFVAVGVDHLDLVSAIAPV